MHELDAAVDRRFLALQKLATLYVGLRSAKQRHAPQSRLCFRRKCSIERDERIETLNVGAVPALPRVSLDIRPDVDFVSDLCLSCSFMDAMLICRCTRCDLLFECLGG